MISYAFTNLDDVSKRIFSFALGTLLTSRRPLDLMGHETRYGGQHGSRLGQAEQQLTGRPGGAHGRDGREHDIRGGARQSPQPSSAP